MDFDTLFTRVEKMFSDWLDEFQEKPMKAGLKVLLAIYILKYAKGLFR